MKVPGGKKTAERLLLELKDKLGADIGLPTSVASDAQADILQALLALGYSDKGSYFFRRRYQPMWGKRWHQSWH